MDNIRTLMLISLASLTLFSCSAKEAYYVTRTLLGYIPPPEVPTIMAQLKEELLRCERSGGSNCEKQAMDYVRTMNDSLKRKPLKGRVVITRVDNGVEVDYEPEELPSAEDNNAAVKKDK